MRAFELPPRYEPIASLGQGGGGEVWAVRCRVTGQMAALKVLHLDAGEHEVTALVREAVALSGVEGLGVPRVLRFARRDNRTFLVRELVEGQSLGAVIADKQRGLGELLVAVVDAADQVTELHRASLLHGDIKPDNIIVGPDGRATIVDLGLAVRFRDGGVAPEGLTPRFAAPELLRGEELTPRAEVYALGATLAEALSARVGDPSNTPALREVAARARAEDPRARFPSADELASALRSVAGLGPRSERMRAVWPIVGLEEPTTELIAQITALSSGGGIVVSGPPGSGRSVLMRRVAWTLGVAGVPVVWVEGGGEGSVSRELELELEAHPEGTKMVALIDDAERLSVDDFARLDAVRRAGGKLVLVAGADAKNLPSYTFELYKMGPMSGGHARELVHRRAPSLSDVVVDHIIARAGSWPGRLREIVERLDGAPIVIPSDVDTCLADGAASGEVQADHRAEILALIERGHVEAAAELLALHAGDTSPQMAIARSRVAAGQGDVERAVGELESVRAEVMASDDTELRAGWLHHLARVQLRAGAFVLAEEHARAALRELGVEGVLDLTLISGQPLGGTTTTESLVVLGSVQSFTERHDEARATLEQAVALGRALGNSRVLSIALGSLAVALQRSDRLADAKAAYEEALSAAERAGDAGTVATMRLNLASIAKRQGALAEAALELEAAIDMGRRSGRASTVRQALINLANLDLYLGRLARARGSLDALQAQRAELLPHQEAQLLGLEAEHAGRSGETRRAAELCLHCASAYEAIGRSVDAAEARLERVALLVSQLEPDTVALTRELDTVQAALGDAGSHRGALALARGRVALRSADTARARVELAEAVSLAEASGQRDQLWAALDARADLASALGLHDEARRDRASALLVLDDIASKLPVDLREVFWNDPRRSALRSARASRLSGETTRFAPVSALTHASDRLARVLEINRQIAGEHDLSRLLERVTDHAIALLQAEHGFVLLRSTLDEPQSQEHEELAIGAARDGEGDDPHARFSRSIADKVMRTGEPVVTMSAGDDARLADYVSVHQLMLQSIACVPIRSRDARVIGALYLETRLGPKVSFTAELPILTALADQVAIAIETARLVGENARRTELLAAANAELEAARVKLEELVSHRTAQLAATRKDLRSAREVLRSHFGYEGLVGTSAAMRRLYAVVERAKDTDVVVLITGESGTGKELVARAIHNRSARSKEPFVGINCGAIPEHLLESELFGHTRGAFTGAERDRKGLFREATDGTLLLDEVGEMPPRMQAALLRVLQEKVVRPVGGSRDEPIGTRVIAATHRSLASMVEAGTFREDLYYRLHVLEVVVPPLRERVEDIPMLVDHFLGLFAARYGRDRGSVSRAAIKRLSEYGWPGNVRQLENVLLNGWVLSDTTELEADVFDIPTSAPTLSNQPQPARAVSAGPASALSAFKADEKARIIHELDACGWNRLKAADNLGLSRRTFYRRLKEYGIQ